MKNDLITYKSYLPLWKGLLSLEQVGVTKVAGQPITVLTDISCHMYGHFISCIIEIGKQLDLTTYKKKTSEKDASTSSNAQDDDDTAASSDPVSGLEATNSKDFQVYLSLVSLSGEVLKHQATSRLELYLPQLIWFLVTNSTQQPLVSSHYIFLSSVLVCSQETKFFDGSEMTEQPTIIDLLIGYAKDVVQRCKQYRDELLVSCLTLIVKMPLVIITQIFSDIVPSLQIALEVGVSYLPLAEVTIQALRYWCNELPQSVLDISLPKLLPLLMPYLKSKETSGEAEIQTRIISVKMAFANQRRKVDIKKMKDRKQVKTTGMRKVQDLILDFIGGLPLNMSMDIIPQDPDTLAEAAVRWTPYKHVKFATPFRDTKIDIYLDDLLPHIVDLALNSSNRQTKVAASELLHSIIIILIGSGKFIFRLKFFKMILIFNQISSNILNFYLVS